MWLQLLIVLVATAATLAEVYEDEEDNSCMYGIFLECEKDYESTPDFPGTEEELEEFCKFALTYLDCAERVLSSCDGNQNARQYFRELNVNFRRVCAEDSLIRSAVVQNLPCLKESENNFGGCHETLNISFDSFLTVLKDIGIYDIEELGDSKSRECLNVLFATGCISASIGQACGDMARNVVVNIIQGFDAPFEACPEGVKENLLVIAEVLQVEAEKAVTIEKKIKRKK